eukprot:g11105.t1
MQFSNCVQIEGVLYLKADFSVLCYDDKWWSFYVVFLIVGIVYILGLPIGVFFYLYSRRHKLDRPEILHSVGWMYTPYNRNAYFWEIQEIIRKMILSGGLIVLSDFTSLQLAVALMFAIFFHQIHAVWKPHATRLGYYLQHVALLAVEIVYISGLLLMLKEPVPDALLVGASGGTVFLGIAMLSLASYMAIKKFINLRRQDAKDERDEEFRKRLSKTVSDNSFIELEKHQIQLEKNEKKDGTLRDADGQQGAGWMLEDETEGRASGSTKVAPEKTGQQDTTKEEGETKGRDSGSTKVAPELGSQAKKKITSRQPTMLF